MVNQCYLCKLDEESCNHIVLWCPMVYNIWIMVYNLFRINWVIVGSVRDVLWAWEGLCKKKTYFLLIPFTHLLGCVERENF